MTRKLDPERTKQIRNELQFRETADLVEIWQTNDHDEWTNEAFEAVRSLLVERLGPIPPQAKSASWALGLEIRAQRYLGRAQAYDAQGKVGKALAECAAAIRIAPRLSAAHNYRGLLLDAKGRLLEAIAAYREAIRIDPNFTEARENLHEAEREWLDEDSPDRPQPGPPTPADPLLSGDYIVETGDLPETLYLSETSRILRGWPGYRTRPKRSGYDYLDTSFELAHMEGVLLRQLFTGKLRTRSLAGLVLMGYVGIMAELPLILGGADLISGHVSSNDWLGFVILSLYWVPGLALLWNVALNLRERMAEK